MVQREKKTKIIWSVSHLTFERTQPHAFANRIADEGQDSLMTVFTPSMKDHLTRLRLELSGIYKERHVTPAPEGQFPYLLAFIGRRSILKIPKDHMDVSMGDELTLPIYTDVNGCTVREFVPAAGDSPEIIVTSDDMLIGLRVGSVLSISFGQVECEILEIQKKTKSRLEVKVKVINAGQLLTAMHVHSTDMARSLFPLIAEDAKTLETRFEGLADYVVVAGITSLNELLEVKRALVGGGEKTSVRHPTIAITHSIRERNAPMPPRLILKLETDTVLKLLPELLPHVDGLFLSRSELGLWVHPHTLPIVQKEVIETCNRLAKLVIVASELLYSMRTNPNPTRAEVSDIANAVADGADAIFLAEQITDGPHSVEVALVAADILKNSEAYLEENWHDVPFEITNDDDAIAFGALSVAEQAKVRAIVCLTEGGYTAMRLASMRTPIQVVALTYNTTIMRQLSLLRSVTALALESNPPFDQVLSIAKGMLVRYMGFQRGDRIVFVTLTASSIAARNSNLFTIQEID